MKRNKNYFKKELWENHVNTYLTFEPSFKRENKNH